ncbi:MAG: glycoside hydrolase family 2 protein [Planctomycetota bacterium]
MYQTPCVGALALEMEGVTGAVFDDNFFDMVPGQTRDIGVLDAAGGKRVTVRALNAEPVTVEL